MADLTIAIWPGSGSAVSGTTPFGFYDSESEFQTDAPKVADWICRRLGYPILNVELRDTQIYACFEESINEYTAQVNQFRIRENMLMLQGSTTGSNYSQKLLHPNLDRIITISEMYGSEAGVGGTLEWKSGSFDTSENIQVYDLNKWAEASESNNPIEIKRVRHYAPPAIVRYFDPYAGTGTGMQSLMSEFGWGGMSPAISFIMMPLFADVLRLQAIEFNDQIRRSGYSFELRNNKLRIFPIPDEEITVWFDYIVKTDRVDPDPQNLTADYSNVSFERMLYNRINEVGKQWIRKYTYILSKELLGAIRRKYSPMPIPNAEITLDGDAMVGESANEKSAALTELRETLEQISKRAQMDMEKNVAEDLRANLAKVPLLIYVG